MKRSPSHDGEAQASSSVPPICDYEDSSYRTDFWEGQGREYEDRAERFALRRLLPPSGRRLLDIGAGFGRLASIYRGYDEVILLDYSQSQLEYARSRLGDEGFTYVAADIYRLPLAPNVVDAAVMVRVLHHIADVPSALGRVRRALGPRSTFILEFANKRHLKNILRFLVGRGVNPFARQPYEFAPLHYDFHPAWVEEQLERAGFDVRERLSISLFRADLLKRTFSPSLLARMDAALQGIAAPLTLGPSVFLRTTLKKTGERLSVAPKEIFSCPQCECAPLERVEGGLLCPRCDTLWPMENGVYIFK
ncbi:MAG: class I SAM-dependent methyltransferase [Anaerolineales bacterium]